MKCINCKYCVKLPEKTFEHKELYMCAIPDFATYTDHVPIINEDGYMQLSCKMKVFIDFFAKQDMLKSCNYYEKRI